MNLQPEQGDTFFWKEEQSIIFSTAEFDGNVWITSDSSAQFADPEGIMASGLDWGLLRRGRWVQASWLYRKQGLLR